MKKNTIVKKTTVLTLSTITSVFMANTMFAATQLTNGIAQSSEYGILGNSITHAFQGQNSTIELKHSQHRFLGETGSENISSIQYSYGINGRQYHAAFTHSDDEQHAILGYSLGNLTLSAMAGNAESFVRDAETFSGVTRFGLHGGNNIGFKFHGVGLDAKLSQGIHTQFGIARLNSNNADIESRGVRYFELSSSGLYSRFSTIYRGELQVGKSIEAGFNYQQASFVFQGIKANGNKRLLRFRTQYSMNHATKLAFDLSQAHDPSHYDESRYTALLSIQHLLGVKPKKYFTLKEDESAVRGKKSNLNRPILIGAGVVAGAALVSSGSDSTDNSTRSQSEIDAAFAVLNGINPVSVRENREYGGWIFRNQDNSFGSSTPVRGQAASVTLPNPSSSTPSGSTITASYHTHAAFDPRYDNENFSPQDINSDNSLGIGGYLATPGGTFQYHFGNNIQLLGRVAN